MDKNEILARLQRGESMDVIADELTAMMNQARVEYETELAEMAAAKEAEANEIAKREAAENVANAIYAYASLIDPSLTEADRMSGADVEEVMNQILPLLNAIKTVKPKVVRVKAKNADEAFNDFFKMFGL
jgi:uncharacterized protein YdiU (UPF0061 family)